MGLCPELDLNSPAIQAEVVARRNAHNNAQAALRAANDQHVIEPWTEEMQQAVFDEATSSTDKHILIFFHSLRV